MESLGAYLNGNYEPSIVSNGDGSLFDANLQQVIDVEDIPILMGSIILDALFYPLHQYLNIQIATESDNNYSANDPFEYFKRIIDKLDIDIPFEKIGKHKALGNPSKNLKDYSELTRPKKNIVKDARSSLRAQIKRKDGLHNYLINIARVLEYISMNDSAPLNIQTKNLFCFYITNETFQIVRNHFSVSYNIDLEYKPITNIYLEYINLRNEPMDDSKFRISVSVQRILRDKVIGSYVKKNFNDVINVIADYIEIRRDIKFDSFLWESISKNNYVEMVLQDRSIIDMIRGISEIYKNEFIISEGPKTHSGNIKYVEELSKIMFPESNGVFPENQPSVENKMEQSSVDFLRTREKEYRLSMDEIRRKSLFDDKIFIIENPFIEFSPCDSCTACPFLLFSSSIVDLRKAIISALDEAKKVLMDLCNMIDNHINEKWYREQTELVLDSINNLDLVRIIEHAGKIIDQNMTITEDISPDEIIIERKIEEKTKEYFAYGIKLAKSTCDFFSVLSEILIAKKEDASIEDLLNSMKGKPIESFLVPSCCDFSDHNAVNLQQSFPYLSRRKISDWKRFFSSFCENKEENLVRVLQHCVPSKEIRNKCNAKFYRILREKFIKNMIMEIRTFGYVNEV